ncbi:MAG: bacillithiol system redox-active protein YtxJ [Bacteroidota bacterium]
MNWKDINQAEQLPLIEQESHKTPCLIFKHSTRCSISSIAKFRLEKEWTFSEMEMVPYYLDLIEHRHLSNAVAEKFEVHHESPQIILLWKGEVLLDASHLDISVLEIKEVIDFQRN